jgi:hypothetical protein
MPRNREKDFTLRSLNNMPVSIDDYRVAPWRQTYVNTTIDFRRWLFVGRPALTEAGSSLPDNNCEINPLVHAGRDSIVEAIRNSVWHIPSVEAITKGAYCHLGLTIWFEYLDYRDAAGQPVYELAEINREVILGFIQWLKFTKEADTENGRLSHVSAQGRFSNLKAVLQYLVRQGALPEGLFPRNPFPNIDRATVGHKPYPKKVMTALMAAFYQDIKAIRQGTLHLNESDVLALYLLTIAARTGRNTTPLLELTRDAVLPHPIKPDKLGLLVTYKRRGRKASVQPFEKPQEIEDMISLPMDALTLYREAVSMSELLVSEAPQGVRNRLWLYRKTRAYSGNVVALTDKTMYGVVKRLVKRHGLTQDGKPLQLNISRLRKTFAQRIWQLSGGDLIATAEHLGNDPKVAGQSYVAVTPEMVANFRRLGILMHADWAGKLDDLSFLEELARDTNIPTNILRDIAVGYNNTGVGRCTDPKNGANALGDGSLCTRWLECFHCPNQLVMESDLHRLFSFYFLLLKERNHISRENWDTLYAPIIQIIDEEIIVPNLRTKQNPRGCFDPYRVNKARAEAEVTPHRMWQDRAILGSVL